MIQYIGSRQNFFQSFQRENRKDDGSFSQQHNLFYRIQSVKRRFIGKPFLRHKTLQNMFLRNFPFFPPSDRECKCRRHDKAIREKKKRNIREKPSKKKSRLGGKLQAFPFILSLFFLFFGRRIRTENLMRRRR